MKLSNWVVGMVLFTGVIVAIIAMMGQAQNQGYSVDYGNVTQFNKTSEVLSLVNSVNNQTANANIEESNIFLTAAKQGYAAVRLVLTSIGTFTAMLLGLSGLISAPAWFGAIILAVVVVLITFSLLAYFSRWDA